MSTFILIIHILACILLVTIILMQSGRGGGLTEVFASAESMFGAKTNEMLIKITTVAAVVFFLTNISLAILNSREGRSLMSDKVAAQTKEQAPKAADTVESKTQTDQEQETPEEVVTQPGRSE